MGLLVSGATPRPVARRRSFRRPQTGALLATLAVWAGAAVMLVPVIWMVLSSFKSQSEILQPFPTFFPQHWALDAYNIVLSDPENPLLTYFRNSTIVATIVTICVLFSSALAGYIFAKFRFFGKGFLFVLVLSSLMVPFQVVVIPLYLIIRGVGLFNTLWALILPNMVSAFGVYLMKQFMEGLPDALIEAGRIEGASEFTIYRRIILPQVRPVLTALGIFTFKFMWNDYLWPLVAINDRDHTTLALGIAEYVTGQHGTLFNQTLAVASLSALPIVVIFLIFQRQFVEGISLSGLKG